MKKYTISGMSCAACQSRVEKAVNALPDVDSAVVSLLTNSMQVEGSASDSEIRQVMVQKHPEVLRKIQHQWRKTS